MNNGLSCLSIQSFAVSPRGDIYAGTGASSFPGGGVFCSTDNGDNWSELNSGLTEPNVVSLAIDSIGYFFAGTAEGVFRSIDSIVPVELVLFTASSRNNSVTLNWKTVTEVNNYGFDIERRTKNRWEKLAFVPGSGNSNSPKNYVYVDQNLIGGTKFEYRLKQIDANGKFEYSDIVCVEISVHNYVLLQNYPNPFNSITKIEFGMMEKGNVKLTLHNTLGKEIRVLINEGKEAGYHSIDFNASNLPSGVYFYRIQNGNFIDTKKMSTLK